MSCWRPYSTVSGISVGFRVHTDANKVVGVSIVAGIPAVAGLPSAVYVIDLPIVFNRLLPMF